MGFGLYAVYEAVDVHLKPCYQVPVLPEVQSEQGINPIQGFGNQLFRVQPFTFKVHKITCIVGGPLAHDDQGKHPHFAVMDLDVEAL